MRAVAVLLGALCLVMGPAIAQTPAQNQYQYPFQNPNLSIEERVTNIISLLTPEEKVDVLGANYYLGGTWRPRSLSDPPGNPRLQPGGRPAWAGARQTTAPMAPRPRPSLSPSGLGRPGTPDIIQKAAAVEGYEARWLNQNREIQPRRLPVPGYPRAERGPRPGHPLGQK